MKHWKTVAAMCVHDLIMRYINEYGTVDDVVGGPAFETDQHGCLHGLRKYGTMWFPMQPGTQLNCGMHGDVLYGLKSVAPCRLQILGGLADVNIVVESAIQPDDNGWFRVPLPGLPLVSLFFTSVVVEGDEQIFAELEAIIDDVSRDALIESEGTRVRLNGEIVFLPGNEPVVELNAQPNADENAQPNADENAQPNADENAAG
jgi:hypothetical protein